MFTAVSILACMLGTSIITGFVTVALIDMTLCREVRGLLYRARDFEAKHLDETDPVIMARYERFALKK